MDAFKEALGGIFAAVRDRFFSPLYLSFAFAWCALNVRFLLVLASDLPVAEKFAVIDAVLYLDAWEAFLLHLIYPALLAMGYVVGGPHIHRQVSLYLKRQEKTTLTETYRVMEETPVSQETARTLYQRLRSNEARYREEISGLNEVISNLQEQLERANAQSKLTRELPPEVKDSGARSDPSKVQLSKVDGRLFIRSFPRLGMSNTSLDVLKHNGLSATEISLLSELANAPQTIQSWNHKIDRKGVKARVAFENLHLADLVVVQDQTSYNQGKVALSRSGERLMLELKEIAPEEVALAELD